MFDASQTRFTRRWYVSRFIRSVSRSVGTVAVLGMLSTTIAVAEDLAQGAPLADVPVGHWVYDAVDQLVKDGLIVGYPGGEFNVNRPMTRYEAAVLTDRAVDRIEAQLTAGNAVNPADLEAVKKLMAAFANEREDVEAHVAALQKTIDAQGKQVADLRSQADATQLRVNQGKLGFNMIVRPGTASYTLNGVTAAGVPIAPGKSIAFGSGANNIATTGSLNTGIMYSDVRVYLGGQIDPRWSYGIRIADAIKYSPFDATTVAPSYCAGATAYTVAATCASTVLNFGTTPPQNTLPLNLDDAYTQYSSPGGINVVLGRYAVGAYAKFGASPNGSLLFGGAGVTGANISYRDPHGHLDAMFYFGQQPINQSVLLSNGINTNAGAGNLTCTPSVYGLNAATSPAGLSTFNGINPFCTAHQVENAGWLVYAFDGPRIAVGGAADDLHGKQYTFYNPNQVTCTVAAGALKGTYQAASAALCHANFPTGTTSAPSSYYVNEQGNPIVGEAFVGAYFGPRDVPTFGIRLLYDRHIGVDPFTGAALTGGDAEAVEFTYASKGNLFSSGGYTNPFTNGGGRRNSNVIALGYDRYGLNSLSNIDNTQFSGAVNYENNGLQAVGISATHWFSDSIRFGFDAYHLQNDFNTQIPITTGGFVTQLQENQANLEMYLYFF
jgi:hypothetical protein